MPGVAAEVLASSLDEQSDAARLAQLIQQDQTLATHLLKVVNSPAFRGASEIVALRQAIARLGMERIREIALTASLSGTLFRPGPYEALGKREWHRALASGLWAKEVSRACRKNVEIAYLCGLLHNVGVPVVLNLLTDRAAGLTDLRSGRRSDRRVRSERRVACSRAIGSCRRRSSPPSSTSQTSHRPTRTVTWSPLRPRLSRLPSLMSAGGLIAQTVSALPAIQHLNLYPDDVAEAPGSARERLGVDGNPRVVTRLDVVVIGSGPAGQKAAIQCAKRGRRVAVVERLRQIGGACVHQGTIPSKALRERALERRAAGGCPNGALAGGAGVNIADLIGEMGSGRPRPRPLHGRSARTQRHPDRARQRDDSPTRRELDVVHTDARSRAAESQPTT